MVGRAIPTGCGGFFIRDGGDIDFGFQAIEQCPQAHLVSKRRRSAGEGAEGTTADELQKHLDAVAKDGIIGEIKFAGLASRPTLPLHELERETGLIGRQFLGQQAAPFGIGSFQ
jgi:hypothetical protein